ncbi:hypothetical protein AZH53_10195 [Methanomicrobiaceae archaeon CYW5]|uniref:hypothetical protein n=1 Tax=Methanovulcanius yangii TaxID=1789227 RepID=UPI0029CAA0F6|nr:hypothetical protein [Methanovulcanius yangii]MBT8508775.1 hypothetical protein [Methanovulcanius yangii]
MKRTTLVIGCVLCLCLCAVAVAPAMAKNVISPQADKLVDHKLDKGMSGNGALRQADGQVISNASAATNEFRMQQFNDSVAWGEALIGEVNALGYDTSKAEAVLAQLTGQEGALRNALGSGKQGQMTSVMAKNNALTKQLRMSLNNCIRANGTENGTMEMDRLRENCTAIDAEYLELRYENRLMYGEEIIDIFNASGYDTTTAGEQLGVIAANNGTFMNATANEDRPAMNKVMNENKKAWNTGKRSLWDQLRSFFFGGDVTEEENETAADEPAPDNETAAS